MRPRASMLLPLALFAALPPACAYEIGGHHLTLNAIFAAAAGQSSASRDDGVIAFCALLPDLSADLDAVILRERVFFTWSDWRWGAAGQCGSNTSRQMVASQFYLHALTGKPVDEVRAAATRLVGTIEQRLTQETGEAHDTSLCEMGFAFHLLGDTYAHSRLSTDERLTLYETGRGHASDGHEPDYILRRELEPYVTRTNRWPDWVAQIGQLRKTPQVVGRVQDLASRVVKELRQRDESLLSSPSGELEMSKALQALAPKRLLAQYRGPSMTAPWQGPNCQSQIDQFGVVVSPTHGELKIACSSLWNNYLRDAEVAFGHELQPTTASCRIKTSPSGQRQPTLE